MTPRQLETFKRLLFDRLTETFRGVQHDLRTNAAREPFAQEDPGDEGDSSVHIEHEDLLLRLSERDARIAQAMQEALNRINRGEFGICLDCGNAIELERLMAVPWALRCADDQQIREQGTQEHAPTL